MGKEFLVMINGVLSFFLSHLSFLLTFFVVVVEVDFIGGQQGENTSLLFF